MEFKDGVSLAGLDIRMRPVLIAADRIYKEFGRTEGVTITSALDGCHSPGSLHYYGLALDLRTNYFDEDQIVDVHIALRKALGFRLYDVVLHSTHIHVEYDAKEAYKWSF